MKVLFFSPFASTLEHSLPERVLMKGLTDQNWSVVVVGCRGYLDDYCGAMAAKGLTWESRPADKSRICSLCRKTSASTYNVDPLMRHVQLDDWLLQGDQQIRQSVIDSASPTDWMNIELLGVPVGRLAAYEFMIHYKLHTETIPAPLWEAFRSALGNVVLTVLGADRVLNDEAPDRVLAYNTLYGVNRAWRYLAESRGTPTYSLHAGADVARRLDTLMLYRDDDEQVRIARSPEAIEALSRPMSSRSVSEVGQSIHAQLQAANVFVYSEPHARLDPATVRERLGLRQSGPVLLAPLASADERHASGLLGLSSMFEEPRVFRTQLSWIEYLLELAGQHPNWQLVIRLHPRMFPNRRESVLSPSALVTSELLATAPPNVRVNNPSDQLGISDLLQVVDAGLVGTSSVGIQMLSLGIPVVVHDPQLLYAFPSSLCFQVNTRDEYPSAVEAAIASGWSFELVRLAFRWLSFLHSDVAREVQWRPTGASLGQENGRPKAQSKLGVLAKAVSRRMPASLQSLARSRLAATQVANSRPFLEPDANDLRAFVDVLATRKDGLHQVHDHKESVSVAEETSALCQVLLGLCAVLGEFPGDPKSLTARIRRGLPPAYGMSDGR